MATKPESAYIERVRKHSSLGVYGEKTHNPFRRGVPDLYYEGAREILWVEYKWHSAAPKVLDLCSTTKKPALSVHQQKWLRRAHNNGRSIAVITGTPRGGIILPGLLWEHPYTVDPSDYRTPEQIAEWIRMKVM